MYIKKHGLVNESSQTSNIMLLHLHCEESHFCLKPRSCWGRARFGLHLDGVRTGWLAHGKAQPSIADLEGLFYERSAGHKRGSANTTIIIRRDSWLLAKDINSKNGCVVWLNCSAGGWYEISFYSTSRWHLMKWCLRISYVTCQHKAAKCFSLAFFSLRVDFLE